MIFMVDVPEVISICMFQSFEKRDYRKYTTLLFNHSGIRGHDHGDHSLVDSCFFLGRSDLFQNHPMCEVMDIRSREFPPAWKVNSPDGPWNIP